jgi:hypothetical protein
VYVIIHNLISGKGRIYLSSGDPDKNATVQDTAPMAANHNFKVSGDYSLANTNDCRKEVYQDTVDSSVIVVVKL